MYVWLVYDMCLVITCATPRNGKTHLSSHLIYDCHHMCITCDNKSHMCVWQQVTLHMIASHSAYLLCRYAFAEYRLFYRALLQKRPINLHICMRLVIICIWHVPRYHMQCVAVCGSVWQCVAVCCSVLQCVAVCCSVVQCVAVCCSVWQCVAVCCSVLQCVAVCCSVLQCVAVCCSVLQCYHMYMTCVSLSHVLHVMTSPTCYHICVTVWLDMIARHSAHALTRNDKSHLLSH